MPQRCWAEQEDSDLCGPMWIYGVNFSVHIGGLLLTSQILAKTFC